MPRKNRYKVAVVGMGGIGSHLMDHLNQLVGEGQFENWEFTIFDDDNYEQKNLKYQKFNDDQVGMDKVEAVFENCINILKLTPEARRATPKELAAKFDIVVVCVDSGPWRKAFFEKTMDRLQFWVDLRSEGRTVAAYTKHKKNNVASMVATVNANQEATGSCQLPYELEQNIIQAGNRIVALIGVQYLLNFYNEESCAPSYNHFF